MRLTATDMLARLKKYGQLVAQCARLGAMDRLDEWPAFLVIAIGILVQMAFNVVFFNIIYLKNPALGGWTLPQIYVLVATFHLFDGISCATYARGMNRLGRMVENGELDVFMSRPVNLRAFLSFRYIDLVFVWVNLAGAAVLLAYGALRLGTPPHWPAYFLFWFCSLVIHFSFTSLINSVSFWTPFYGGPHLTGTLFSLGMNPPEIYRGAARVILSTAIPALIVFAVPSRALFGTLTRPEIILSITLALLFYAVSRWVWRLGMRHYESANG